MTRKIPVFALGVGMLMAGSQAFAHGNHSHGPALTEAEVKASEGIFADKDVKDRPVKRLGWYLAIGESVSAQGGPGSGAGAEGQKKRGRKASPSIGNIIRRGTPPTLTKLGLKTT
ncbi:Cadmium-induced protein ZinT [Raoultella terrigena]|uniref:Cadmium-induced protein ZinT n=1 Tax=Raoultella terrigena TaxID=577 RepID=A0A4U9DAM2_RAOTE|nr:Cadmium-induced protein ZinT [Raoultella terrigena]